MKNQEVYPFSNALSPGKALEMAVRLAQACLFTRSDRGLRKFLEVVSSELEHDDGQLVSFRTGKGPTTVASHPPVGDFEEGDVVLTIEAGSPKEVDAVHRRLVAAGIPVADAPETTEWGYHLFHHRVSSTLVFEVSAPAVL